MANPATVTALKLHGAKIRDDNSFPAGWNYSYITLAAPTTTVIKSGAGFLNAITLNNPAANAVVTIYDNTVASGTAIIGTITVPAAPQPTTLFYDVAFTTGLTVKTATAAQDITVTYV